MKIWHVGVPDFPQSHDHTRSILWLVATEQVSHNSKVSLVLDTFPSDYAIGLAAATNLELIFIPSHKGHFDDPELNKLLNRAPPDLVHLHALWQPGQTLLAQTLVRRSIPYVITPHGDLSLPHKRFQPRFPQTWLKKQVWSQAAAITAIHPQEREIVRSRLPDYSGRLEWVPNAFEIPPLCDRWPGAGLAKKLICCDGFGRMTQETDYLTSIAQSLPEIDLHLYEPEAHKAQNRVSLPRLKSSENMYFHSSHFKREKLKALTDAALYIQPTHSQDLPESLIEAMALGVPCAVMEDAPFAALFYQHDLGLVLSPNPQKSADQIRNALSQSTKLHSWSQRASAFLQDHLYPEKVALRYLDIYAKVLSRQLTHRGF